MDHLDTFIYCLLDSNSSPLYFIQAFFPDTPNLPRESFPPVVCLPTTSGTGAEMDSPSMFTDTASGVKRCAEHPHLSVGGKLQAILVKNKSEFLWLQFVIF